ncbi:MAG TPA: acyl-CoA dehydrogenase [Acidobacteriota bacterium]|nr:acyl-CoA dehydrogenase [Acidobacteriota bacterium]
MDFQLNEEQLMMQDMVREFAQNEVLPGAADRDAKCEYPKDLVEKVAELGLMGVAIPEEMGGAGMDYISYSIAIEEISKADAALGVIVSVNNSLVCDPLVRYANEDQVERFLKPLAAGQKLGAYALSEAQSGSDAANVKTMAIPDGDDYVLNGQKLWITNGAASDVVLVFAMTDKEKGHKGINCFIVEKGTPGFEVGKKEDKLGIRSSDTTELNFEDCRVPAANLLGKPGEGFKVAMSTLDAGRIGIAAQAVGVGQASIDASIKFAKEREAFGKTISHFQAIQFYLADMQTKVDAARLLTWEASWKKDQGQRYGLEAAMCKTFASETAVDVALKAVQIHGAYGYSKEFPVERYMRDAKITEIYEGTNEIQRLVIARYLLSS